MPHGRGKFCKLAQLATAPPAIVAGQRTDAMLGLERTINGLPHEQVRTARQDRIRSLVAGSESSMRDVRRAMSRHADVAIGPLRHIR